MPNWCNNVVTFKHDNPKLIAKLVRGYNKGKLMSEFFPCPKALVETMSGSHAKGTPEAKEHEIQQQTNFDRYGYPNWYDWQIANWGSKWDTGRDSYEYKVTIKRGAKEVTLSFDTAWSPPLAFYEKMCDQQQFKIAAMYFEPGCGFVGRWSGEKGDEYYDFSCNTSRKALTENVPADLLEEFGILEFFDPEEDEETDEEST